MIGKSEQPKWQYDFDCRKCDQLREVHDDSKSRHGYYCIPAIEAVDKRPAGWTPFDSSGALKPDDTGTIHADDDRHVRCDRFVMREAVP